MRYCISEIFKERYKSYAFFFKLWFEDGHRFVCYEDFNKTPKGFPKKKLNESLSFIELKDVLETVEVLSTQYEAAKLKPPRLCIHVHSRQDSVFLEEYLVEIV